MSETKEDLSSPDQKTKQILTRVSERLDGVIKNFSGNSSEKPTFIDPLNPDIRSSSPGYKANEFRFWGSLEERFPYATYGIKTAIIKDIKIPDAARSKGWGAKVLTTWESAMVENGINSFAATNIKDETALNFWLKQGYQIPQQELGKRIPYAVIKTRGI